MIVYELLAAALLFALGFAANRWLARNPKRARLALDRTRGFVFFDEGGEPWCLLGVAITSGDEVLRVQMSIREAHELSNLLIGLAANVKREAEARHSKPVTEGTADL